MSAPALSPAEQAIVDRFEAEDDELDHLFCDTCSPAADTALCGTDLTLTPFVETITLLCVVCDDLDATHDCGGS